MEVYGELPCTFAVSSVSLSPVIRKSLPLDAPTQMSPAESSVIARKERAVSGTLKIFISFPRNRTTCLDMVTHTSPCELTNKACTAPRHVRPSCDRHASHVPFRNSTRSLRPSLATHTPPEGSLATHDARPPGQSGGTD